MSSPKESTFKQQPRREEKLARRTQAYHRGNRMLVVNVGSP
jgi:hypothetical protein